MVIDDIKYLLDEKNYYDTEFEKRQIVLANTFSEKAFLAFNKGVSNRV